MRLRFLMILAPLLCSTAMAQEKREFVHPGIPLTIEDLDYVKANLGREPWKSGYEALKNDFKSKLDYPVLGPREYIARFPGRGTDLWPWRRDMMAVHNLTLMWYFTDDDTLAQKARDILIAWADTQKKFDGWEAVLDLGDYVHRFVTAADILRGVWKGWTEEDTRKVKKLFREVYFQETALPVHGLGPANKGTLGIASATAIAVFLDDHEAFEDCLLQLTTHGPSSFPNTVGTGQIAEFGRDLGHGYGQWLSMAFAAEIAWKQGYDVYGMMDNRLLAVGEYYSRQALGYEVPFLTLGSTDALYHEAFVGLWPHGRRGINTLMTAYKFRKGFQTPWMDRRLLRNPIDMEAFCYYRPGDTSTATPYAPKLPEAKTVAKLETRNIGKVTPAGKAKYDKGIWTLSSGGEEIWRHNDERGGDGFFFACQEVKGDFDIIARVDKVDAPHVNAKAALMMRENLTPSSRKAWVAVTSAKKTEWFMSGWTTVRGGKNWEKGHRVFQDDYPIWIRLQRLGDMVYEFWSPDGANWSGIGAGSFKELGAKTYIGLATCSVVEGKEMSARFSNVRMTGGDGNGRITVPSAPLTILANGAVGEIQVRWSQTANVDSYQVYRRSEKASKFVPVAVVDGPSYYDNAVEAGVEYTYHVVARNAEGESGPSGQATAKTRPNRVNIALDGEVFSSPSGHRSDPYRVFDGSSDTFWVSAAPVGGEDIHVGYKLNDRYAGSRVVAYAVGAQAAKNELDPVSWRFEGSRDGETWQALDKQKGYPFANREVMHEFTLEAPADYRFYRLNLDGRQQPEGVHIGEMTILAEPR